MLPPDLKWVDDERHLKEFYPLGYAPGNGKRDT
jgi:hypothetical protein